MVTCDEIIRNYIEYLSEGFSCRKEGPFVVLTTPYLYSDGDTIELFIEDLENYIKISDMGETARRLANYKFNWNSNQARSLFAHILNSTGITSSRGALYTKIIGKHEVGPRVSDLIQAILQTDNLVFSVKSYAPHEFRDEVEIFLRKEGYEPELNYQIEGESGTIWRVHFFLNHKSNVLMKALTASSKGGAKYQVSTTYTAYDDIKKRHEMIKRSVILDDDNPIWDSETIHLLERVVDIDVGYWSKREEFGNKLRALAS